jgi:error-prone DNA polymerase
MRYTELQVTTNFSFLRGASHPEEMVEQAIALGYKEIAITDRNTMAGIVRAHAAAKSRGIRIIPACRLDLMDGPSLLAYPTNNKAYASLCALLTLGNFRAEKGKCHIYKADLYQYKTGIHFIIVPDVLLDMDFNLSSSCRKDLLTYKEILGKQIHLVINRSYEGFDAKRSVRLQQLSEETGIPLVATNDVHYHHPSRRPLQDVLTCIREKCTIQTAGYKLHPNAERFLKPMDEMFRLFRQYPQAIEATQQIAEACSFSLDELHYQYPEEITSEGRTPQEELTMLAWKGAHHYFGELIPPKTIAAIQYELEFIERMNYAAYFLTVFDIVRYARERGILCQGRGSAANSTICYCLGITSVNPEKFDLLFERFISAARNEPPDIDVDFEHERREEVIQYIYQKYGRDRAAIVATVTQQHQRGAIRDVGKAMGLSVDTINRISGSVWEFTDEWFEGKRLEEQGLNPNDKLLRKVLKMTREYIGFPRQLGQHTGGFVITRGKLTDLCPILNARMEKRTCIEWNKDDIDALGFMKIDVLALGMLTCISKAFDLAKQSYGIEFTLANIPQDDPAVYDMICKADTIGVFQIESRAQQSMLPRLKPRCFYDLVIEVAIVRPGPIQGDMVHPYLRRRNGEEAVTYPSKELKDILGRTLGVPLFQEQAMKIAIVAAGFTPSEADDLRRSMATFKAKGLVSKFHEKLIRGMTVKGYDEAYAERVFKQLEGFGSYGFPESHAASFAQLVYVSSWLKCHYPDVFACALLNSMPMGFYQPAQIISDATKHGVEIRPADINHSFWDNTLEESCGKYHALRLGFRQIKGMREQEITGFVENRKKFFRSVNELREYLSTTTLEKLADADAFRSIEMDRRKAFWEVSAKDHPIGIFHGQEAEHERISLPLMATSEHVVQDYASLSLSLKAHPVSFLREKLEQLHVLGTNQLSEKTEGMSLKVAGLVLVRQRPGTAKGVCFMTIEDEFGFANLVIFEQLFDRYRKEILQSRLIMVEGKLQKEGDVIHVIVSRCYNITKLLRHLTPADNEQLPLLTLSRADERSTPTDASKKIIRENKKGDGSLFHRGRNFK